MSSAIELGKGKAESEVRNETYTIGHKNRIWLHGSGQENEVLRFHAHGNTQQFQPHRSTTVQFLGPTCISNCQVLVEQRSLRTA